MWQAPPISPGRIAILLVGLVFISGFGLTLFYVPTAAEASSSLDKLNREQPIGWLIRNLHRWSALLLLLFIVLHALRVWLARAYRYPRDLNWLVGLLLLFLAIILGGTGYLLRWDIKAFALMDLVISNLSGVPVAGPLLVALMLGSDPAGAVPLNRGYALHIWFLPFVLLLTISLHFIMIWRQGLAHQSGLWQRFASRIPLGRWSHFLPGLGLLILLLLLSWFTPQETAVEVESEIRSPWPHPDWLLMFYFLPFWFFKGPSRVIGTLLIPLALALILTLAPRLLQWPHRQHVFILLATVAVVSVFLLFGQISLMGSQVPLSGCAACHGPAMIGGAPTTLSEFDIRDPDWLVFHLREPTDSLLVPFDAP